MFVQDYIKSKLDLFNKICESYKVRSIYAFGSSVNNDFIINKSDIDLVVEIDELDPISRGNKLLELWNILEDFFQRKVDMLTPGSIKNPILKNSIDKSKVLIYER